MPVRQNNETPLQPSIFKHDANQISTKMEFIYDYMSKLEKIQDKEISHEENHIDFLERTLQSLKANVELMRTLRNDNIAQLEIQRKLRQHGSFTMSPALTELHTSR